MGKAQRSGFPGQQPPVQERFLFPRIKVGSSAFWFWSFDPGLFWLLHCTV